MINQLISGRITSVGDGIAYILSTLVVIFLTLPIHEFAHGLAASKLGDPTPRYQGRLTLNPLAHIDYIGAACILLVGFGWAKPVGVNPTYFKHPKRDMAITALAGPVSNLIVALILTAHAFYPHFCRTGSITPLCAMSAIYSLRLWLLSGSVCLINRSAI